MKTFDIEIGLVHAAPERCALDNTFTERVMASLPSVPAFSAHIQKRGKRTLWSKLQYIPKFAIIALAITALLIVSTVTYAIVETIKKQSSVVIDASGVNEHGREQLNVTFDSCEKQKKNGTMYELKKDSKLSADDGVKVLQAQCERDSIIEWIQNDPTHAIDITTNPNSFQSKLRTDGFVGTYYGVKEEEIVVRSTTAFGIDSQEQTVPFPKIARVVEDGKVINVDELHSGDTILYFSPHSHRANALTPDITNVTVFKLKLDAKYYSIDMQAYVRPRQPCENNVNYTCVVSNNINAVTLEVSRGGALNDTENRFANKTIQGKVISWNDQEIKLDVGAGTIYTFRTARNIIAIYNQTTVYGLKSYDTIYANTDPEELKIRAGDSLEVHYQEDKTTSASAIEWTQTQGFFLMVERRVDDLSILRKY